MMTMRAGIKQVENQWNQKIVSREQEDWQTSSWRDWERMLNIYTLGTTIYRIDNKQEPTVQEQETILSEYLFKDIIKYMPLSWYDEIWL